MYSFLVSKGHLLVQGGNAKVLTESKQPNELPKIQQTKLLVTCQRFGDLFLFELVWSGSMYSSVQTKYIKGRFKVMATYLQQ